MAQLLIRKIEPELKLWLEVRAKRNGRSLGEEAYEIICKALGKEDEKAAAAVPAARAK
jgi:plasmid stability protein